jgi:hypothetical protein
MKPLGLLLLLLWGHGCDAESKTAGPAAPEEGLLIHLTPDPSPGAQAVIAQKVAALEYLLDATDGFNNLPSTTERSGPFQTVDNDGDGVKELLLKLAQTKPGKLPVLRLDPGKNQGKQFGLKVRGLDVQQKVVAEGTAPGNLAFKEGQLIEVQVPFNLSPNGSPLGPSPPRIMALSPKVLPAALQLGAGALLSSIAFYVSKPLDESSVRTGVSVSYNEMPVSGSFTSQDCPSGMQMWLFAPQSCLSMGGLNGSFRLIFSPQVKDTTGQSLTKDKELIKSFSVNISAFGACSNALYNPQQSCSIGFSPSPETADVRCDSQSGRFEPAPCALAP